MNMKQKIIETSRLILRPIDLNDADTIQQFAGNYNVAKTTMNIPHPYEDGMAEAWIGALDKRWQEDELINFAIIHKNTKKLMGVIGLVGRNEKAGGVGYWVGEPFWGNGYCTEATIAFIDFCFNHLNIERLEAEYLVTNPASGRVMEKSGMLFKTTKMIKDRYSKNAELSVFEIHKK